VNQGITFVGLDAHKKSISVSMLLPGQEKPVEWQVVNEPAAVKRMVRKIEREAPGEVRSCYEAGPCGYALQRQITDAGEMSCMVVAPSLIPKKPGERIKTDRRDARKLAELFRAGLLTEVQPPSEAEEAARDLCRAREVAREDLHRCRHRLSKMLLRRGIVFSAGKRNWSQAHQRWLKGLRFDNAMDQAVFDDYLLAIEQMETRHDGLAERIEQLSMQAPYAEPVGALRCFRGIDTITAMTIVTELHGFIRFTSPRGLMAYLGLVPSEHSSSDSTRRGSITKTGNGHVRRVLIEASWHYRHRPSTGALKKRRKNQPAAVIAIADRAMQRLHQRYQRMTAKGKPAPKAVVAVARELVGFIWAAIYPLAQKAAA
jgi:transposase